MLSPARVVLNTSEQVRAGDPRGKRLLAFTLRYPYEVRKEDEYFDEIEDEKIPKDMADLAAHIVETKAGHFKPEKFQDHYEEDLKQVLKKKQAGGKNEGTKKNENAKSIIILGG